jgi:glucose/mannose-6-phosphate isomerase
MNEQHQALLKFSYQIDFALKHYHTHGLQASKFQNIIIAGLGGSGIGGQLAKSIFKNILPIPLECVADYHLPAYASENTLLILGSYSGNTEETLSVFAEGKKRGCKMLAITSGGNLKELATQDQIPLYNIEQGFQPRMALGFSLTYLILILSELCGIDKTEELKQIVAKTAEASFYQDEAQQLFNSLKSKINKKIVVLADSFYEPVAIRFCQQIQENAKHECFYHTIPEMNHNVIESYYGQLDSVFILIYGMVHDRTDARFEFIHNLLEVEHNTVIPIALDEHSIYVLYQIIYVLDWLSLYIADLRRVDSLNVPNIKSLKEFLDSVN